MLICIHVLQTFHRYAVREKITTNNYFILDRCGTNTFYAFINIWKMSIEIGILLNYILKNLNFLVQDEQSNEQN